MQEALDMGISLFAGELEGRMDLLLQDAANETLQPIYNYMKDLPALQGEPTPILPTKLVRRTIQSLASFDAGRGCPYQCSFCTIINVQGRKSRGRSADDVEKVIREHIAEGLHNFFITDDNFARNSDWEPIFDRLIELRERDKLKVKFIIQVDTLCHKIPDFIEKAGRAGVNRVFIGLENINPANLIAAKKRQNKITEYRKMLLAWKRAGVVTYAGYILGFAADTPKSIRADIEIIKNELPIDILEFFMLTPLPGSEDHKVLWEQKAWMDSDMNKYDSEHAVADHPNMSRQAWEDIYHEAWQNLLHARAHGNDPAASRRDRHTDVAARGLPVDVCGHGPARKHASASGRSVSSQISARPPTRISDRADLVILSEVCLGMHFEAFPPGAVVDCTGLGEEAHPQGSEPAPLYRSGAGGRDRWRNRIARIVHA